MRAIARRNDDAEDLALITMDRPTPSAGQLLVRVYAAGVGIHDAYFLPPRMEYPYPIGIEAAGIVEEVGIDVQNCRVGQPIAFVSSMQAKGGTWAEYAVVDADALIVSVPEGLTFAQAAAFPVAGNTVLKAFHALDLKKGQSLLIAGGSGAIGSFAIQLAAQMGVDVAASASPINHDYMIELGVDLAVDYNDATWAEQVRTWRPEGVDAALAILPKTPAQCLPLVKDKGNLVIVSGDQLDSERSVNLAHIPHEVDIDDELRELMDKAAAGNFHVEVDEIPSLEDALAALADVQTRHSRGKRVLVVKAQP